MKTKKEKQLKQNAKSAKKDDYRQEKMTLEELIKKVDDSKKRNPLDLSSDQDLSIALMNLVSLEEHFFFSGAKTHKTGFYDLINPIREMRKELMERIVKKNNAEVWCISKHLLAASMRLMEVGTKALGAGNKKEAYEMFDRSYELYSLFWGLNMGLINLGDVKKVDEDFFNKSLEECKENPDDKSLKTQGKKDKNEKQKSKSMLRRLGDWVKNAVNCCVE